MILLGRLLMALVLVVVIVATLPPRPLDDNKAQFEQVHKQYLTAVADCLGRGATQYRLCRELAFETFITKARHLK